MIDPDRDLEYELKADYRVYTLTGSHAESGRQVGSHAEIGRQLGSRLSGEQVSFGPSLADMHPDHAAFARACRTIVADVHAPLVEEIGAFAEGAGKDADDVLWHYCLDAGAPPGAGLLPLNNCSTVGVMTTYGPIIARNYDFFYFESLRHLITIQFATPESQTPQFRSPDTRLHNHTGMWTGLVGGRYDGVNSRGVWISMHGGGGRKTDRPKPGVAFHHLCRIVLETCATAREAIALLQDVPHIASYNYFVADTKEMFVVEAHPQKVRVREPELFVLAATNHPLHSDMTDLTDTPLIENSRRRMQFLTDGASRLIGHDRAGVDELEWALCALMRNHTVPVCGHTDGLATFWSAVCTPSQQRLAYSLGAPCRNDYVHATWP